VNRRKLEQLKPKIGSTFKKAAQLQALKDLARNWLNLRPCVPSIIVK
jgi:hypothetical protein